MLDLKIECSPVTSGILWNIGRNGFIDGQENYLWTTEQWRSELNSMQRAGIDTVLLNGTYYAGSEKNNNLPYYTKGDLLLFLFEETAKRGIKLILETYVSSPLWENDCSIAEEIRKNYEFIEYLNTRYGHFDNFYGWYLGYETCIRCGKQEKAVRRMYREITAMCHEQDEWRPVLISPFYMLDAKRESGPVEYYPPEFYKTWWAETLLETGIDILALQDSGAEHIAGTTLEDRRPFFEAVRAACEYAEVKFWGNVEAAEVKVNSFSEYAEKFGWGTWVNQPVVRNYWHAVDIDKFIQKLRFTSNHCEKIISWGWREFMRPSAGDANRIFFENYLEYVNGISAYSNLQLS